MSKTKTEDRLERIEAAAYILIAEQGFKATSMLAIARRAKVSNETLYRWYGDKTGLFNALVLRNSDHVQTMLKTAINQDIPALYALGDIAPVFLKMLLGSQAIALNQAACADPTGSLGKSLAEQGRQTIAPLFLDLFNKAETEGTIAPNQSKTACADYLSLLIGDLQIRRATGAIGPLSDIAIAVRVQNAQDTIVRLYAP